MRTATTKVRRETYETFQRLCKERETTPYAELREYLLAFVEHFGGGGEDEELIEAAAEKPKASSWTGWNSSGE